MTERAGAHLIIERPSCARCGYDLRGAVESWRESCPVAGACSECGLGFEWADALREDRQRVGWLYEHARHWWSLWSAIRTLWMLVLPWRFWGRVRVHHGVVGKRLALWALWLHIVPSVAAVLMWCLVWGVKFGIELSAGSLGAAPWSEALASVGRQSARAFTWIGPVEWVAGSSMGFRGADARGVSCVMLGAVGVACTLILVCPSEWRKARVRGRHLARVAVYGLTPVGLMLGVSALFEALEFLIYLPVNAAPLWGAWPAAASPPVIYYFLTWSQWDSVVFVIDRVSKGALIGALLWMAVYWWFALRRGMELRRVWGLWVIAMAGLVLGALLGALVLAPALTPGGGMVV